MFFVAILILVVMFPFIWMVQLSLRPADDAMGYNLLFTPTFEHFNSEFRILMYFGIINEFFLLLDPFAYVFTIRLRESAK